MTAKRILPCLDIRDKRVVKGKAFADIKDINDPLQLALYYDQSDADELVLYDITASAEGRHFFGDTLNAIAKAVTVPLVVGGGVNTLHDFERLLNRGAAKVSINSGAIKNPAIVKEAARQFGSEKIVLSVDVKKVGDGWRIFSRGGQKDTGLNALEWAQQGEANGAGELVVNSIDSDGVQNGYDMPLLKAMAEAVSIPLVASGGAGTKEHFAEALALDGVGAALAASIFHSQALTIPLLKGYLKERGIAVNMKETGDV